MAGGMRRRDTAAAAVGVAALALSGSSTVNAFIAVTSKGGLRSTVSVLCKQVAVDRCIAKCTYMNSVTVYVV